MIATTPPPFARALKRWRTLRRMSQLELASRAETPPRHVSFLETGRSRPSEGMVLRLARALELPLQEQNTLLTAAGFGAAFAARELDDAALGPVRFVIANILRSHAPYPAIVVDRWYDILDANFGGRHLFHGGAEVDRDDPVNLVEALLGPLRPRIINWDALVWDARRRLRREVLQSPDDARLADLLARLEAAAEALPGVEPLHESPVLLTRVSLGTAAEGDTASLGGHELALLSTFVNFGTSHDVTVEGLHIELIFPADPFTDQVLRAVGTPTSSG